MKNETLSEYYPSHPNFSNDEEDNQEEKSSLEKPDPFDLYGQKVPDQDPSRTSADTIEHDDSD